MKGKRDDMVTVGHYETDVTIECPKCGSVVIATDVDLMIPLPSNQVMEEIALAVTEAHDKNHCPRKATVIIGPRNVGDN